MRNGTIGDRLIGCVEVGSLHLHYSDRPISALRLLRSESRGRLTDGGIALYAVVVDAVVPFFSFVQAGGASFNCHNAKP